jgi:phenylacetic acid degradation operon negative regulatory protein
MTGEVAHMVQATRSGLALRAAAMIVTIYGDIVVPRGGVLWMGTLVDVCGSLGISETLVRTAVSRLVSAGQLVGERDGRRSYYRLAETARAEFAAAARLLYGPLEEAEGWLIHHAPDLAEDVARNARLASIGPGLYLSPNHSVARPLPGLTFRADAIRGESELPAYAATLWNLEAFARDYDAMISRFSPLAAALDEGRSLLPADAVATRLLLVHVYRTVLLKDPRLPASALPVEWPGLEARRLFSRLYRGLSPSADAHIGAAFEGRTGLLPAETDETTGRIRSLAMV